MWIKCCLILSLVCIPMITNEVQWFSGLVIFTFSFVEHLFGFNSFKKIFLSVSLILSSLCISMLIKIFFSVCSLLFHFPYHGQANDQKLSTLWQLTFSKFYFMVFVCVCVFQQIIIYSGVTKIVFCVSFYKFYFIPIFPVLTIKKFIFKVYSVMT